MIYVWYDKYDNGGPYVRQWWSMARMGHNMDVWATPYTSTLPDVWTVSIISYCDTTVQLVAASNSSSSNLFNSIDANNVPQSIQLLPG